MIQRRRCQKYDRWGVVSIQISVRVNKISVRAKKDAPIVDCGSIT